MLLLSGSPLNNYAWSDLFLRYLLIVVIIAGFTYLTTIVLARYYKGSVQSGNIKLIEKINLAADRSLWLVELGNKYYFLYVDKNGMSEIDKFEKSELVLKEAAIAGNASSKFMKILKSKMKAEEHNDEE